MHLILLALEVAAIYCGVAYLYTCFLGMTRRIEPATAELYTFHLGLCFILSVGFLGLLLRS